MASARDPWSAHEPSAQGPSQPSWGGGAGNPASPPPVAEAAGSQGVGIHYDENYLQLPSDRALNWSTRRYAHLPDQLTDSTYILMPDMVPHTHVGIKSVQDAKDRVSLASIVYWQETFRPVYLEAVRLLPGASKEEFTTALVGLMKKLASQHGTGAFREDPTKIEKIQGTRFGSLGLTRD